MLILNFGTNLSGYFEFQECANPAEDKIRKSAVAENHPSRNVMGCINLIASTGLQVNHAKGLSVLYESIQFVKVKAEPKVATHKTFSFNFR